MNTKRFLKQHCRYCNHILDTGDTVCPACKQSQSRSKEIIALSLIALTIGLVSYFQLFHNSTQGPNLQPIRDEANTPQSKTVQTPQGLSDLRTQASVGQNYILRQSPNSGHNYILKTRSRDSVTRSNATHYQNTSFQQKPGDYPYYVAEKRWNAQRREYEFYRRGMHGSEVPLKIEARRYFLSEDQREYPEPESGCGPTALLNLYIWYTKFGLLKESIRHSNLEKYKQLKFRQIDRKLLEIQRASRTRSGGTNTLEQIVAMDELVQQYAKNPTRLHFEIKKPPLKRKDFTSLSLFYRVGILSVRPKDPKTGRLMGNHAVLCVRGDTAGMISIANWGDFSHGYLVEREDGQWFIPKDASQYELRINQLTTLIPFTPS